MTRRELAKFLTLGSGLLAGVNVLIAFIGLTGQHARRRRCGGSPPPTRSRQEARCCSATRPTTTRAFWCATRSGRFDAFSQVCTHLSCAVVHRPGERRAGVSRATRDRSPRATAARWPGRRRGACRASCIERRGADLVATGIEV